MSLLNIEVKKTLEDIIDVAFEAEPQKSRDRYKKFWLEIIPVEYTSFSGRYFFDNHKIEIYNLSQESKVIVKTCIHELAHHIELCKTGNSGHQKSFYEEYKKLLYAAFSMRILTPDDIEKDYWSSEQNKVKKIAKEWVPTYVSYKQDVVKVNVLNGYPFKDALKERGYKWDALQAVWTKQVVVENMEEEKEFLAITGCEYTIASAADLNIEATGYILAVGDTYECREALKEQGFYFDKRSKKGVWRKKVKVSEARDMIRALRNSDEFAGVGFGLEK